MEATIKTRRSVVKKQKKEAAKLAKQQGATTAKLNNVPSSDRKMRLVADLIRKKNVVEALGILKFQAKIGARSLEKLVLAAMADWQAKNSQVKLEEAELYIKEINVNGGRMLKRLRPAPQGRGYRVRKRSNHITLLMDSRKDISTLLPKLEVETAEGDTKVAKAKKAPAKKEVTAKAAAPKKETKSKAKA
jgi:large subunit ribosomal protein L22